MPLYESINEINAMLEKGNEEQRVWAICSLDIKKKNYDLCWEIFLSDTNFRVRANALCACCHCNPKKMWHMLEYILENEIEDQFVRIIARHLLEQKKKEENKK